ncbi:MAG: hypothetical protein AAGA21_06655 [Pseudomonadota bacterium]
MFRERFWAVLAFFLIGLMAVFGLNMAIPPEDAPDIGQLGKRAEFFTKTYQDYNVLFVGTSSTYRGVDPVLLQEVAARNGCDVRAFNFGIPKLRFTELRYLQERLTPEMLRGFDLIFLAPMASSKIRPNNWSSDRIQYFSDFRGYWDSLVDIWHTPMVNAVPKQIYYSSLLTGAFAYRQLGIGRLADNFHETSLGDDADQGSDVFGGDAIVDFSRHGHVALDDEPSEQFAKRGQIIKDRPGYFDTLKQKNVSFDEFRGSSAERALQRFEWTKDYFPDFEGTFGIFLPPLLTTRGQDTVLAETAEAQGVPVLNYNLMDRYPELFELEHWFDYYHLGRSGAEVLTRLIGEDICPLLDQKKS